MAERVESGTAPALVQAEAVARQTPVRVSANGIRFAQFAETGIEAAELERMVQAVPVAIAAALQSKVYYFVPLVLAEGRAGLRELVEGDAGAGGAGPSSSGLGSPAHRTTHEETMVAPAHSAELAEMAICHRNVELTSVAGERGKGEGVFISTRLLSDRFSLAFELFINVGHGFVEAAGVAEGFGELVWGQATADVRGETSLDAWESRAQAVGGEGGGSGAKRRTDEKAKGEYLEAAFADAVAIYLLSLATDFDYSELREREYPLLAPQALAERLRLMNRLFPANAGYEFAIRYRRRA